MKNLSEDWEVFDFTDAEAKILWVLVEQGAMRVSKISRESSVPRTTVFSALSRLKDRGFVRQMSKGHKKTWKVVRISRIENKVQEGVSHFEREKEPKAAEDEIIGGVDTEGIGIKVYKGKRQILRAYEQMLTLSKSERVFVIQGNRSAKRAIEGLEENYLFAFHEKFKKAHIIMEGISGEYILDLFRSLDTPMLKSHLSRMLVMAVLPDKYIDFSLDVLIMRKNVIFIDIEKEYVIFIQNSEMVEMFNRFAAYFQDTGEKVNLNRHIWKIIEEKEKT